MGEIDWILCPFCGSKTRTKIRKDTVLINFPLFCPKCKQKSLIEAKEFHIYDGENTETYFSYNPQYANTVEHLKEADMDDENVYSPIDYNGQSPIPKCQAITEMDADVKAVEYFIRTGKLYPGIDWSYSS